MARKDSNLQPPGSEPGASCQLCYSPSVEILRSLPLLPQRPSWIKKSIEYSFFLSEFKRNHHSSPSQLHSQRTSCSSLFSISSPSVFVHEIETHPVLFLSHRRSFLCIWQPREDLNLQPPSSKHGALPVELRGFRCVIVQEIQSFVDS